MSENANGNDLNSHSETHGSADSYMPPPPPPADSPEPQQGQAQQYAQATQQPQQYAQQQYYQQPNPQQYSPQPQPQFAAMASGAGSSYAAATTKSSSGKTVRIVLVVIGVLMALALIGTIAFYILNSTRTPEKAAEEYLGYLAAGDANAASQMVDPGKPNNQRAFLTNEAMAGATARIENFSVTRTDSGSDDYSLSSDKPRGVTLDVEYYLDGQVVNTTLQVTPAQPTFLVLKNWKIDDTLATEITLQPGTFDSVTIGSQSVPITNDDQNSQEYQTFYLYPGIYPAQASYGSNEYVNYPDKSLIVGGPESSSTLWWDAPEPTEKLQTLMLDRAKEFVESCASLDGGNLNEACPSGVQSTKLAVLEVTKLPTALEDVSAFEFVTDKATIKTQTNPTEFNKNPSPDNVEFRVSGQVTFPEGSTEPEITELRSSGSWW